MKSTVQRFRLIGITILSILPFTIVGAVSLSPAYAVVTMTLNISPNPQLPGQPVTFSGKVTPSNTPADTIVVFVWVGTSCFVLTDIGFVPLAVNLVPSTPPPAFTFTGTALSDGSYSIPVTAGFPVGSYSVQAFDVRYASSSCDPFSVSPVIPEYPFGLAVLAVFMIIAYGVIRRKTATKQK